MEQALVKNAGDVKQIKRAAKKEDQIKREQENDVRYMLNDRRGRRFVWRMLTHAGVYNSIWVQSAEIHYKAGKQDFGHWLMAQVLEASEDAYTLMVKENRTKQGEN